MGFGNGGEDDDRVLVMVIFVSDEGFGFGNILKKKVKKYLSDDDDESKRGEEGEGWQFFNHILFKGPK